MQVKITIEKMEEEKSYNRLNGYKEGLEKILSQQKSNDHKNKKQARRWRV